MCTFILDEQICTFILDEQICTFRLDEQIYVHLFWMKNMYIYVR